MGSKKASEMFLLLLVVCVLSAHTCSANGCCPGYMKKKIPYRAIRAYSVQTIKELCPIDAIIFHTKRGKGCTDPTLDWVQDYVERLGPDALVVPKSRRKNRL